MKKSLLSVLLFSFFLIFCAFGEVRFISPVPGVWGNKQMLIIDNASDSDYYYYSINGSDPEKFGFAYDGPVLLDIEGDVTLKVTHFDSKGNKDFGEVKYSVVHNDGALTGADAYDFIYQFSTNGFYEYFTGDSINIPNTLSFSLESTPKSYIPGVSISMSTGSVFHRFIPCTLFDSKNNLKWRFLIKVNPSNMGVFSTKNVPFTVDDWETITFNDDSLIYKIDSEYWGQSLEPFTLDRSVSHMISWQNIDYKSDNQIEYFVLPPKAEINKVVNEDGSMKIYPGMLESDNINSDYNIAIMSDNQLEFFPEIIIDTFYGDKISGEITIGIFAESVLQTTENVSFNIDKLPPAIPKIIASTNNFYSRNPVDIVIPQVENSDLYISVSEPFEINNSKEIYKENSELFNNVVLPEFTKKVNDEFKVQLPAIEDKVVYYKVAAFTKKNDLESAVAQYSVVVDQSSYFYNKNSISNIADGTIINPFITFDQCVEAFEGISSVSLSVVGDLYIDQKYELSTNIKILNHGNGRIIFGPNGSLEMNNASLEIVDCRIHKIPSFSVKTILPFFRVSNGTLDLKNCQIAGDFSKNGTIVDCFNSIINIQDSIVSVTAESYSSFISCSDSNVSIFNSSITSTGGTCVIISANNGELIVSDNTFKVMGRTGRIAELFGVNASFENNEFKIDLSSASKDMKPIFANKKTILVERDNITSGF